MRRPRFRLRCTGNGAPGPHTETLRAHFARIYDELTWTDLLPGMPASGRGSLPEYSASVSAHVREQIAAGVIRSIADLGCGDLTYLSKIEAVTSGEVDYLGIDIVPSLITEHRKLGWGRFVEADITSPSFRVEADFVLCKDVLFHLDETQIASALRSLDRSRWSYLVITTNANPTNADRAFDRWHYAELNLEIAPYHLQAERHLERLAGGSVLVVTPAALRRTVASLGPAR